MGPNRGYFGLQMCWVSLVSKGSLAIFRSGPPKITDVVLLAVIGGQVRTHKSRSLCVELRPPRVGRSRPSWHCELWAGYQPTDSRCCGLRRCCDCLRHPRRARGISNGGPTRHTQCLPMTPHGISMVRCFMGNGVCIGQLASA
jgi:hypothetical protein